MTASIERAPADLPLESIRSHLALVANRDLYDPDHIDRIGELSIRLAESLGLRVEDVEHVERVAQLRDVGKAMVPIAILRKSEPLDDAEWARLQRYPEYGAVLVAGTVGWEHLAPPVRAGNERWDGAGYPDGLAGEDIPQASRITYVAQAYLAMTSDRPYRVALSRAQALVEMAAGAGTQFCPATVTALVEVLLVTAPETTEPAEPRAVLAAPAAPAAPLVPAAVPDLPAEPVVRASVARPGGRTARSRWARAVAIAGVLAGTLAGLALVLPLPDVAAKCPGAGEGRAICQIKDIAAPALTVVIFFAFAGMALLSFVLVRLPGLIARHRGRERNPLPVANPFETDPVLAAASWGVVYDDHDHDDALRLVGRRRWRQEGAR